MALSRYQTALLDPALVFRRPEDIVRVPTLSREQKIELLRRWQYEEDTGEGTPDRDDELRRRIFVALAKLVGSFSAERDGMTARPGPSRSAFDRRSGQG